MAKCGGKVVRCVHEVSIEQYGDQIRGLNRTDIRRNTRPQEMWKARPLSNLGLTVYDIFYCDCCGAVYAHIEIEQCPSSVQ